MDASGWALKNDNITVPAMKQVTLCCCLFGLTFLLLILANSFYGEKNEI